MPYTFDHNSIGKPFIELQSIDSTNNYARSLLHEGLAEHGTVIFAHEQLSGKGQRGKVWTTEKGANIILSVVVNTRLFRLSQQFELSACISVAVHDFFAKHVEEKSPRVSTKKKEPDYPDIENSLKREKKITKIKWPNDLYFGDRKAGGILIENIVIGNMDTKRSIAKEHQTWQWAIVGIGININQTDFPSSLSNPVSLKQITGQHSDTISLAKELCVIIKNYYEQLITEGFDNIYTKYLAHLYKKNEIVKLKKGSRVFDAVIKSVSPSGELIIKHGIEEEIRFGEVEWV